MALFFPAHKAHYQQPMIAPGATPTAGPHSLPTDAREANSIRSPLALKYLKTKTMMTEYVTSFK